MGLDASLPPLGWILLSIFFGSSRRLMIRFLVKKEKDYIALLGFDKSISLIYLLLTALLLTNLFDIPIFPEAGSIPLSGWLSFFGSAVLFTAAAFLVFRANRTLDVAEREVFGQLKNFWVLILSYILLHELITGEKILGIFLISAAVFVISADTKRRQFSREGIKLILIAEILVAAGSLLDKIGMEYFSPLFFPVGFLFLATIFSFALMGKDLKKRLMVVWSRYTYLLLIFGTLSITSFVSFYFALQQMPVSTAVPLKSTQVILSSIAGAFVLGETKGLVQKLAAALIAVAGVFILQS